jgi:hypothetical protein
MGKTGKAGVLSSGEDLIRRLIPGHPGGMASSRYDNIVKWAQGSGNEALAKKLASGQITPDELHAANVAYFEASRRKPMADVPARQMELPMDDGPPPNDLRPLFGDQTDWEETGDIAARILNEGQRGMVPYGTKGPGVAVGGPSGPGVAGDLSGPGTRGGQMIPSRNQPPAVTGSREMSVPYEPDVNQMGISEGSWTGEMPSELSTSVRLPRVGDGVLRGDATSLPGGRRYRGSGAGGRPINAPPRGRGALTAAGVAGLGGIGVYSMMDGDPDESEGASGVTDTSGTADLAAESAPPPVVDGPPDYSFQARELMDKLNAMRRKAGVEVPEAKAMMAEINRLLDLSNKQRNAPGYEPPMPTDYHGEAQRLIQKLNARRMEVGGEVPETNQVMAEVRRLQALGDQQRNARR